MFEANPDATILAGGTDVGLWVTKQQRILDTVISLNDAADLRRIDDLGGAIRIAAAVRYADAHVALMALHPQFDDLLRRLGGLQVRNLGTVCGNIANGSPIGDMPPALIAAGAAQCCARAPRGEMPLEASSSPTASRTGSPARFVGRRRPKPAEGRVFHIAKLSKRFDQDISAVCLGLSIGVEDGQVTDARVAFGGMATTPKRAAACEAALTGQPWSRAAAEAAAAALALDFTPITDMRASADYRLEAARNLLIRAHADGPGVREAQAVAYV